MRKLVAAFCCVILLLGMAVTVSAASGKMNLVSSKEQVRPGESFTVEAKLSDAGMLALCAVALEFDENILELTDGTCDVENISLGKVLLDSKAGTFLCGPKIVSGTVFSFEFRVKENAVLGYVAIDAVSSVGLVKGEEIETVGTVINVVGQDEETTPKSESNESAHHADPSGPTSSATEPESNSENSTGTASQSTQSDPSAPVEATGTAADPTTSSTENVEQSPEGTNPTPVVIAIVAGVALVGAGAFVAIKFKKKKEE